MNRFTIFSIRLLACVLVIIGAIVATIVRAWVGMPSGDVWKGLVMGLAFAWAVSPSSEDMRAFVGLMQADD